MQNMVYNPAETELDIRCITIDTTTPEDVYSTTPLRLMHSIYQRPNEDELYSSFEEAISDRVCALNKQREYLSVPMIEDVSVHSAMSAVLKRENKPTRFALLRAGSWQLMLHLAIAAMLIMVGFDLMGLLVLLKI
jgi:hypothetical protein